MLLSESWSTSLNIASTLRLTKPPLKKSFASLREMLPLLSLSIFRNSSWTLPVIVAESAACFFALFPFLKKGQHPPAVPLSFEDLVFAERVGSDGVVTSCTTTGSSSPIRSKDTRFLDSLSNLTTFGPPPSRHQAGVLSSFNTSSAPEAASADALARARQSRVSSTSCAVGSTGAGAEEGIAPPPALVPCLTSAAAFSASKFW
mmetsp:Transcript_11222/g.23588  ORF Transcript_11222/g.23588 Transcript_11222/m.23588 type:complete len:203 (-) Transcript_11222:349-957(-)